MRRSAVMNFSSPSNGASSFMLRLAWLLPNFSMRTLYQKGSI